MNLPGEWWSRWRVRAGYPLAAAFLWLARPTLESLAAGAAVGVAGLAVRALASGHLRKHEALAKSGPYAYTRNPLYVGSAVLAAGVVVAARSWAGAALVAAYLALFYPPVMKREEAELRARYGVAFDEYAARVPRFWPRPPKRPGEAGEFSWALYRRNREYQAALGFLAGLALLWARMQL